MKKFAFIIALIFASSGAFAETAKPTETAPPASTKKPAKHGYGAKPKHAEVTAGSEKSK